MRKHFYESSGLVIFLWLVACAKQAPPPGGPLDETPPKIVEADPQPGAVRVARDVRLRFRFSEKIDHRSLRDAIFVTPIPRGDLHFDWHGTELKIDFPDSLRPNTTHVVTLGTSLRDLRNNRLEESFNLAFSTGDSIATGEIRGKIFGDKIQGILVGAFLVEANRQPDPARDTADYTTQSGKAGDFEFRYLATGLYRLYAIDDKYGNRLYDRGEDAIGVASRDLRLDAAGAGRVTGVNLRLALEDTLQPALSSVVAPDNRHLEWRFEEPVEPRDGKWLPHLRVVRSPNGLAAFELLTSAPHPLNPEHVYCFTAPQAAGSYRASASDLFDLAGLPLDSLYREVDFVAGGKPDTTRPRLVRLLSADSARGVALTAPVEATFSELMRMDSTRAPLVVRDSAGVPIKGVGKWKNHFQFAFEPSGGWESRTKYAVEILADSTFDLSGLALFDTVRQRVFWTVNADTLSSISGMLSDDVAAATGPLHLTAKQIVGGKAEYETTLGSPGPYEFAGVLPGIYQLRVYRDANNNGRYDFGKPFPFLPAERFIVAPDSIKVRSRWPNEGNDLTLP